MRILIDPNGNDGMAGVLAEAFLKAIGITILPDDECHAEIEYPGEHDQNRDLIAIVWERGDLTK